jgi:hypothetical protein
MEEIRSFSGLPDNDYPRKKLALSFAQRQQKKFWKQKCLFLMAFGTIGFGGLAEGLLAIVTDAAMLILAMRILRHLQVFLFHLEDLGVTIGAFSLMLVYMRFVAEENRSRAPLGFKFNIPATRFFLLGIGDAEYREAQDAKANH